MLQAEVHGIEPNDFPSWDEFVRHESSDPFDDDGWFTVHIGCRGGQGTDLWQVRVATRAAVGRIKAQSHGMTKDKRRQAKFKGLIVENFNGKSVETAIHDYVTGIKATTWEPILDHLRKAMDWEYEGR
jgi:hypothetical protein